MEELLIKLGVEDFSDNHYTGKIESYDVFSDLYSILESSVDVHKISTESYLNDDDMYILFEGEDFTIELKGSLKDDTYSMEITKGDN